MSKASFARIHTTAAVCVSGILGASAFLLPTESAHAQCQNQVSAGPVIVPASGSKVRIGDFITIIAYQYGVQMGGVDPCDELHVDCYSYSSETC